MVRETRHLWVGNLPDNIREDRIREHFKRYGRVQNVKLLGRMENANANTNAIANSGVCATVAFMDIKSASKAHNVEHVLDERTLTTEYYEPAAIPSSAGAPSAGSSPAGSGYSGSSSSVNSAPAPVTASRYHLSGEESAGNACAMAASAAAPATWRGTNDSATEYCRRGTTPAAYGRTTPHNRWYANSAGVSGGAAGGESTPSTPGGGTERRRRPSGSGSSRSESSSPEPSDTSRASTPAAPHHAPHHAARRTPPPHPHQWPSTANGRPLAICVRNLPTRSTDSSLKDGLYHEYKKHGKVVWVKVVGQNADRYAVVRFKKPSDVEKALEVSQDKLFFGCKISVAPHQSCDDDAESAKPYETDIDEYHPKATRTLFIGNLEKDVTQQQLRDKFKHFGRIIEIDIKKGSGGGAGYAFCQYASISSVVEAIRAMDGEYVGNSRVKLGFGKPVATTCVWVDGLTEHTEKQVLGAVSRCGAATSVCVDRAAGAALVHFEQAAAAGGAVRELRRVAAQLSAAEPDHPRLCVDYASRECQEAFYEQLEKHGGSAALAGAERVIGDLPGRYAAPRHDTLRYEAGGATRSRAPSFSRASSRTPRYNAQDHYDPADYAADRRYRVFDELGSSPQTDDATYEERLQSVVVSPHRGHKHRRDSSPEGRKHSKERHRSAGGGSRRSRSGSRGHASRRRHRKRRDGSESRGSRASRAGTPLRDELDAPPTEPRRPPRERPPLPMSLPLPKFAVQLLRAAPPQPRLLPPAPASPPRPPSASSSSGGSAPHSPSLEERIRSLDEKYERWTGSRAHVDAPDRSRLRHRLLELDINEVKPSEVVRSLLAKRSVFDEDSERLEGAARVPSPGGSPRSLPVTPSRVLRYPFPAHAAHMSASGGNTALTSQSSVQPPEPEDHDRLRLHNIERINKHTDECSPDIKLRLRTPSIDRPMLDVIEKKHSPTVERSESRFLLESESLGNKRRNSFMSNMDENKTLSIADKATIERINLEKSIEKSILEIQEKYNIKDNKIICNDKVATSVVSSIKKEDNVVEKIMPKASDFFTKFERKCFREENKNRCQDIKQEIHMELNKSDNFLFNNEYHSKSELILMDMKQKVENDKLSEINCRPKDNERFKDKYQSNKTIIAFRMQSDPHFGPLNCIELPKKNLDSSQESTNIAKNNKDMPVKNLISSKDGTLKLDEDKIDTQRNENVNNDKAFENCSGVNHLVLSEEIHVDKVQEDFVKTDKDKLRHRSDKPDKNIERDKSKNKQISSKMDKHDKERKIKDDSLNTKLHSEKSDRVKTDKESEKITDKDREVERSKDNEDKIYRHDNHKKDKQERDRKKDLLDNENIAKGSKKEEKHKNDRSKKDSDPKRDNRREGDQSKSRKSSRDESSRDICRKDSTDSTTSRASHESSKSRELENIELKEETKSKLKSITDVTKMDIEKDTVKHHDHVRLDIKIKIKSEIKDEKDFSDQHVRNKIENYVDNKKVKTEGSEKSRHYSLDSPSVDTKRKERLNSCSSLPSNIGHKRRMSSQDSIDCLNEEIKKGKSDRREAKESKMLERHKTTKFSKGHFAKIIESKTKDDRKNQVKPPDDMFSNAKSYDTKDISAEKFKGSRKSPIDMIDNKTTSSQNPSTEPLQNNFDFLATLELRSSEEDERQKALRKEMKEKKRIQQLQQIQELQMQQDALQQAEISNKIKDDRKIKNDEKKKEVSREKRLSTDRKSKDEKIELSKRRSRKQLNSTDTSDSDEPKKHSIFDIVDDEYNISMYDKVKARSCKNMQKQEEEKRQEKIKAKFSQLKQSRAKREEKKRSSWDEDSDSDNDRRKSHKVSMDSSSDEDHLTIQSKKREKSHGSSLEYDRNRTNDYFDAISNEEDSRNKLSRKNSRTRIISDSSDDGDIQRKAIKSPCHIIDRIKKEVFSDSESSTKCKDIDTDIQLKQSSEDKVKKTSLLNLFGKSDSEDNRLKCTFENDNEYNRMAYAKTFPNDLSSENESMPNRMPSELRRKHKKKQKKYKFTYSDDDNKSNHDLSSEIRSKHKNSDKIRRHSSKKEKRKDKIRESVDTDELRDEKEKIKIEKRSPDQSYDSVIEGISNNNKKEGKMEDIFGPLSDESDREIVSSNNKMDSFPSEFDTPTCVMPCVSDKLNSDEIKMRDKEEIKRRKEKRRKEKRHFVKEDDNSLDVDAVSKAIEARLFADSNADDNHSKLEKCSDTKDPESELKYMGVNYKEDSSMLINKYNDKSKKESRDRKKKKKKNREDRQSRKEHHHEKFQKLDSFLDTHMEQLSPKTILDIPLPTEIPKLEITDKSDDSKSLSESPSLPRITDSPTFALLSDEINNTTIECETPKSLVVDEEVEIDYEMTRNIEITDIPMPPPIDNIVQDISEVPLPTDPPIDQTLQIALPDKDVTDTDTDVKENEDAVRSISNLEKDDEKTGVQSEKNSDINLCKVDKKVEEKPRAIISQEETEDAVAALLGESFGGKVNTFDCYEEVECSTTHEMEIESTIIESEIIPEEDAEEMRQAVQNLNASEMEMKPDTPVSDDNLLLIDTDTEETEETTQDAIDRLPVNIIATNQSLNNNTKATTAPSIATPPEVTNIVISKPKPTVVHSASKDVNNSIEKINEKDNKPSVSKQETVEQITSTATPVITSWTLSNNKLIESHVNVPVSSINSKESIENKPTHITANIVQIKPPTNPNPLTNNSLRPIMNTNRFIAPPYQVINQMVRPQVSNIQPPTIKIPEPHIIYQKPQNIVISPRMNNDPILTSPKSSIQTEGMPSPRLPNMTILNTSPQSVPSPNAIQQRSPGQVTVVRMQQPPLSPIHTMHIPHARAMVSPNRPSSVLVQTQGAPIHYNRLPVTPVLAPISKQMNVNNVIQQTKSSGSYDSVLIHQQKMLPGDRGKSDVVSDPSKMILSPTRLQNLNPTVMTQSRVMPMQSSLHVSNINTTLNLSNKVLLNNKSPFNEKRDVQINKSEHNVTPFTSSPIIHLAGSTHTSSTIIQASTKSVMCNLQEVTTVSRGHGSNVIHSINTQRQITSNPISNAMQLEANKCPPSVLSMATVRTTSSGKSELSNTVVVTTPSLANVVMTPLLLKTSPTPKPTIRLHTRSESEQTDSYNHKEIEIKVAEKNIETSNKELDQNKIKNPPSMPEDHVAKCETDFEELLNDKINEIKIITEPHKKTDTIAKTVQMINQVQQRRNSTELTLIKQEEDSKILPNCKTGDNLIIKTNENDLLKPTKQENIIFCASEQNTKVNDTGLLKTNTEDITIMATKEKNAHVNALCDEISDSVKSDSDDNQNNFYNPLSNQSQDPGNEIKNLVESDYWSGKDIINIESVIKKVDSLCNDNVDEKKTEVNVIKTPLANEVRKSIERNLQNESYIGDHTTVKSEVCNDISKVTENKIETFHDINSLEDSVIEKNSNSKRGGRSVRGKRADKNLDKVQTRQIAKTPRGTSKRGRGRVKVDKKIKNMNSSNPNNMPGDVYDFHEDSGDETVTSPNKSEVRPRLILTIKSPLSGNSNAVVSTLSITQKDVKVAEKQKEEKVDVFASPSTNTRKSRRLQEKDIQRSSVDDIIDDVIKSSANQFKLNNKDSNKKKTTRQAGIKTNDKGNLNDTRKSPRGVKRSRDRSLSDASTESCDENIKTDEIVKDCKIPKLAETDISLGKCEPEPAIKPVIITSQAASCTPNNQIPIMKPPKKKMISEISAKLASAFEAAANATNRIQERSILPPERPSEMERTPPLAEPPLGALGEGAAEPVGDAGYVRRLVDNVPPNMMPVGATEATDARVQSPALPHRPPSSHHLPDRVTPILVRGGDGEGGPMGAMGAMGAVGAMGAMGAMDAGAALYRGAYAGPASLPRGAHHPPLAKQVAVIGQNHHPGSRVTITSVPSGSPQGQMAIGEGMYPHFSHHHYQMYQQHFRATQQENRENTPTSFTRGSLDAEGSEAPTPPLELRRPPSARVPRPAHSPSQHDRHIMYAVRCGRSPPPAHGTSRPPSALPPPAAPGPPHASQVPREADSLQMLLRRYPVMWQGLLALKNDSAAVQMHFVGGNPGVAADALSRHSDGTAASLLRIAQRMRLEPAQLDQVHRKMKLENEHCMLLALPCGRDHMDVLQQSTNLTAGFITYLQRKQAAGIVNVAPTPGHHQSMYTVHIFPSCEFANENLTRIAPDLMHRVANIAHLLIVIATAIG